MARSPLLSVISGAFLVSGTAIGAGMLGMPLLTGVAGFLPAAVVTTLVWFFMYLTGLAFLEATLWRKEECNILSLSQYFLGRTMRFISGGMFAFLYYALMVAYFAAGAPLLGKILGEIPTWGSMGLFCAIFGSIVALGVHWIDRVNIVLTVGMIATWALLIGFGTSEVDAGKLVPALWNRAPFAAPILFSAFGFHNIIPSLTTYLKRDRKILHLSILVGTLISLVVYLVWQWLVIGSVPREELIRIQAAGLPATAAMAKVIRVPAVYSLSHAFAFFAIMTSTLGVSFSLVDFLGDGIKRSARGGWMRWGLTAMVFIPPAVIAGVNPHIFDTALGIAGGFGEAFLNGLLPVLLVWAGHAVYKLPLSLIKKRLTLGVLGLAAVLVAVLEIIQLQK